MQNNTTEEWRDVVGYEGLYLVSNLGRVRSLKRNNTNGKLLKPCFDQDGYQKVSLSKNNVRKSLPIHRLVAMAFLTRKNSGETVVNHKNEDKSDNRVSNLEWCTIKYNNNYKDGQARRGVKHRKPIYAIKGDEKIYFPSITAAMEYLGVRTNNIGSCLAGKYGRKTVKGYRFEYAQKN